MLILCNLAQEHMSHLRQLVEKEENTQLKEGFPPQMVS